MAWDNDAGSQWPRWKPWDYFGYYYLGPVRIPPQVPLCGMTDRTTGKVWYLCFDPANGNRLSLIDTLPLSQLLTVRIFAPWDGPYIDSYGLRMGVDQVSVAGVLGTHVVFDVVKDSGAGPFGFQLNGGNTQYAQVGATSVANPNLFDHLAYTLSLLQPPAPTGPATADPASNAA